MMKVRWRSAEKTPRPKSEGIFNFIVNFISRYDMCIVMVKHYAIKIVP